MWILQKLLWPGLAYFAQQLLKTKGALAPVPPPPQAPTLSYAHAFNILFLALNIRTEIYTERALP